MLMSQHSWFHAKLERIGTAIPVPPLKGDALRCSTVLPYLESYHYQADSNSDSDVYYTEHDLNRKLIDGFTLNRIKQTPISFSRAEDMAKQAADMAAYIKSTNSAAAADAHADHHHHHPPHHQHPHQHSQLAASASHHRAPAAPPVTSTPSAAAGVAAAGRKRSRKSASCMSVSKLASCRQS